MLEIANLEVVYHSVVLVLKEVSLTVPDGQIVALLGPNGAGKTTILRAMTGLLPIHDGRVTKGSIRWNGSELAGRGAEAIVRQGLVQVMEGRRIFPDLTVEENLRAGAYTVRGSLRPRLQEFYEQFPVLGQRRNKLAGYLSGGEQQMLAIARALVTEPRLLLLDEPSLGLAPQVQAEVASLIRRINASGVSILLVEQNAAMALDLASHGYVMETGRIVLEGSSAELVADEDIQEFYLGAGGGGQKAYRDVKLYRRRKRWLS